jgi:hypothetical protein
VKQPPLCLLEADVNEEREGIPHGRIQMPIAGNRKRQRAACGRSTAAIPIGSTALRRCEFCVSTLHRMTSCERVGNSSRSATCSKAGDSVVIEYLGPGSDGIIAQVIFGMSTPADPGTVHEKGAPNAGCASSTSLVSQRRRILDAGRLQPAPDSLLRAPRHPACHRAGRSCRPAARSSSRRRRHLLSRTILMARFDDRGVS